MFSNDSSSRNTRSSTTFLSIVGLMLFVLIFIAVYLQWHSFLTEHKNDELNKRLKVQNNELLAMNQATKDIQFQYHRLRALIQSARLSAVHIPGNIRDFQHGTLLWDPQTQRSALLFDEFVLPPDTNLCIWWKGATGSDWQLANRITRYKPDTIYTHFDLPSFNNVSGLLLRLTSSKNSHPSPDNGREIARVTLNASTVYSVGGKK